MTIQVRRLFRQLGGASIVAASLFVCVASLPASAETTAGTVISNTATATFTDGNGTSLGITSNSVTVTVQNAPTLTVVGSNQTVTAGMVVVDTFTLTNTGNTYAATAGFALPFDASFAGAAGATLDGYVLNGLATGTCSVATPCNLSTLNAQGNMASHRAGDSITIGVEYQVSATATSGQTVQTTLTANVTYSVLLGAQATTSANVSATPTDTVQTDARLDIEASATSPGSSGANITWTITANNGGGAAAQGLSSAMTLLAGSGSNGIAIFIPVPSFGGTHLQLQAQPSSPTLSGASANDQSAVYYNASPCSSHPTSGWSTTYSASAECLALFISNSSAAILPSASSQSSGAGSVTTAQISFSFTTNQPSGTGAGNANSVTLVASSAIGGTSWATGAVPILGQGLTVGSTTDAATATLLNNIQSNTTPSSGTTAPGGASNQAGSQQYASYQVLNGPYGVAGATGWYPGASGSPSADTNHDFTALNVACTNNSSSSVNGASCTVATNIVVVNTVQNSGNLNDTVQLAATAPSGWTVQLYNASGCSGGGSSWPSCTQGSSLTSVSSAGGTVSANVSLASNATLNYEVVFNATSNSTTPFNAYTAEITATGQSGSGTGADTNNTFDTLYPGGVVELQDGLSVSSSGCPAGASPAPPANTVCPGGTVSFTVTYTNLCPSAVGSNLGSEPVFAYNALYTQAGTLVVTDDGNAAPAGTPSANNWATYTFGLNAAPTGAPANTSYAYSGASGFASGTYPSITGGYTKFVATIGGSSFVLGPGGTGTITCTVK